jgi:uncharacterized protein (DUF736 family)
MEYDNTNSGVLFKNESDNEKAPAYKGKLNVDGTEYNLAAWIKTGKSGQKFMSLKVELPKPKAEPRKQEPLEDDIPF